MHSIIKSFTIILTLCCLALPGHTETTDAKASEHYVTMKTDLGTLLIELYPEQAPITVKNFLAYVDSGFYNGTIFHRVIPGFVVQGGGFTFDFKRKETMAPIKNESDNGLKNTYLTLSMARTSRIDSATSQFFINLKHNESLDGSEQKPGYAVFGKVIKGEEVVQRIVAEPRGIFRAFPDAPNAAVRILDVQRGDHYAQMQPASKLKDMIAQ